MMALLLMPSAAMDLRTLTDGDAVAAEPIFYAYALHGGAPCSLYIGHFPRAFAEALAYRAKYGGAVHLDQVAP